MEEKVPRSLSFVEAEPYYHIDRKVNSRFESGTSYFIGAKKNSFLARFDVASMSRVITGKLQLEVRDLLTEVLEIAKTGAPSKMVNDVFGGDVERATSLLGDAFTEYLNWIRETVFEEVRREYFPQLPSRHRCLWLIPLSKKAVDHWWERLDKKGRLLEVRATGKIFRANEGYLKATSAPLDRIRGDAFRYWAGGSGKQPHADELLFEGFLNVTNEVDPATLAPL